MRQLSSMLLLELWEVAESMLGKYHGGIRSIVIVLSFRTEKSITKIDSPSLDHIVFTARSSDSAVPLCMIMNIIIKLVFVFLWHYECLISVYYSVHVYIYSH